MARRYKRYARGGSPPADAPNPTPTFIGRGARTTDEPVMNFSRGEAGDLMYESLPAEVDLHSIIGPYRGDRVGRPPPEPVGGYGTDDYAPGYVGGVKFPTWNITPGNRVFDLGDKIPSDWIPYRGSAPDSERNENESGDLWSNNFDPNAAGFLTPADLQARGEQALQRNDNFNNPRIGFFGPIPTRFIPMQRGGNMARGGNVPDDFRQAILRTIRRALGGSVEEESMIEPEQNPEQFQVAMAPELERNNPRPGRMPSEVGGGGQMNYPAVPRPIDDALASYHQGQISSKELQNIFKMFGWSVDLRKTKPIKLWDPSGKLHYP